MLPLAFETSNLFVQSCGIRAQGSPEIRVTVAEHSLLPECKRFLRFVADYLEQSGRRINPGQTMNYGYWFVKFQPVREDLLEVWEYNAEATDFVKGGSLALRYWRDQQNICRQHGAVFSPPRADKLTAVAPGVLEGVAVEAVRYPMGEHMSGWFLLSENWDKNVNSLTNHHTYHVTATRPDLARFLALPTGFRVDLRNGERVWMDEGVANQPGPPTLR
jgi:hypothetical protein